MCGWFVRPALMLPSCAAPNSSVGRLFPSQCPLYCIVHIPFCCRFYCNECETRPICEPGHPPGNRAHPDAPRWLPPVSTRPRLHGPTPGAKQRLEGPREPLQCSRRVGSHGPQLPRCRGNGGPVPVQTMLRHQGRIPRPRRTLRDWHHHGDIHVRKAHHLSHDSNTHACPSAAPPCHTRNMLSSRQFETTHGAARSAHGGLSVASSLPGLATHSMWTWSSLHGMEALFA